MIAYRYFGSLHGGPALAKVPDCDLTEGQYQQAVEMHGKGVVDVWYLPCDDARCLAFDRFIEVTEPGLAMMTIRRARKTDGFDFDAVKAAPKLVEIVTEVEDKPKKAAAKKTKTATKEAN